MPSVARRDDFRAGFVPEIESLRGIAITLVFLYHADFLIAGRSVRAGTHTSPLGALLLGGHTGVSLFFVLSGFLLSPPFLSEAMGGRHVQRSTYFARRALRILPLYVVAVFAATLLTARRVADLSRALPYLVFLRAGFGPLWPYSGVWWSLRTEVEFYLLLPLLPWLVGSRRRRWCSIAAVAAYTVLYIGFATRRLELQSASDQMVLLYSFFGRAPLFAFGASAGWLYERHGATLRSWVGQAVRRGRFAGDAALLAALVALASTLRRVVSVGVVGAEIGWQVWHLLEGALWTVTVLLLLVAPLRTKPFLANHVWRALGRWSYSFYMIHFPVMWFYVDVLRRMSPGAFTSWDVPSVAAMGLLAAVCVGLSAASYRTIEQPFLRRKARIGEPARPRGTAAAEAAPLPV